MSPPLFTLTRKRGERDNVELERNFYIVCVERHSLRETGVSSINSHCSTTAYLSADSTLFVACIRGFVPKNCFNFVNFKLSWFYKVCTYFILKLKLDRLFNKIKFNATAI